MMQEQNLVSKIEEIVDEQGQEEQIDECYDCHEYEFIERLECISNDYVRELWGCLNCSYFRVLTKSIGVRD